MSQTDEIKKGFREKRAHPSGPLSEPPFLAPGTLNWTTASLYFAFGGDARSVLYRVPFGASPLEAAHPIFGTSAAVISKNFREYVAF